MDSAALAVPVGVSRKVDVNGAAVTMIALRHPPMTPIEDFRRDWRRWSAAERMFAASLSGLWASSVTTAILGYAHLL
jgi:hypothetical protein